MTYEHAGQPRPAETQQDFDKIAHTTLDIIGNHPDGILWDLVVRTVTESTGYADDAAASVFMELGDVGAIHRSRAHPRAGVVITERGQLMHQTFEKPLESVIE